MSIELIQGDCLEKMQDIPDKSIDMILTDPPYGTTACSWDTIIPLEPMWKQVKRVIKDNGAIALFGSEPFSSNLRLSNIVNYKYDWYWDKKFGGNYVNAKRMPLKTIECISIFSFSKKLPSYYPIMINREKIVTRGVSNSGEAIPIKHNKQKAKMVYNDKCPITRLYFPQIRIGSVHPTQKPVKLLEYLIKTYTNENETVLDFTMGSGSTGCACVETNRNFIGIELDENYFKIATDRIDKAKQSPKLFY